LPRAFVSAKAAPEPKESPVPRNLLIAAAAGGSFLLLAGAYVFQFSGYPPCPMCWWQRYPHFAAVAIGVVALAVRGPVLPWLGALAALTTTGLGVMHLGVERDWWDIQTSCTSGGGLQGLSGADLLSTEAPRVIMCDQVAWELWGISLPAWNAIFSAVLVILWVMAARASVSRRAA
jgi:disulfide bond formation protein DsbB